VKVRMLVGFSGTLDGVRYPPVGGVWDVSDAAGARMCAKGQAEPVAAEPRKATAKKAEKR
jgi:hypothetical protein